MKKQVPIEARVKKVIEIDGLKFTVQNGNGRLDPYEDWRLTPKKEPRKST